MVRRAEECAWLPYGNGTPYMILKQYIKFTGLGVVATAVQYASMFMLVQLAGVYPVLASTDGFVLVAFVNCYLNYIYTFRSSKSLFEAMPKFFTVASVGLFLDAVIMEFFISFFGFPYITAQLNATALVLLWSFAANRKWTFMESSS